MYFFIMQCRNAQAVFCVPKSNPEFGILLCIRIPVSQHVIGCISAMLSCCREGRFLILSFLQGKQREQFHVCCSFISHYAPSYHFKFNWDVLDLISKTQFYINKYWNRHTLFPFAMALSRICSFVLEFRLYTHKINLFSYSWLLEFLKLSIK